MHVVGAYRVRRGIGTLINPRDRQGWVVSFTPWPPDHFTHRKECPEPTEQKEWVSVFWRREKNLFPCQLQNTMVRLNDVPPAFPVSVEYHKLWSPSYLPVTCPPFGRNIILSLHSYSCLHFILYNKQFLSHIKRTYKVSHSLPNPAFL